MKRLQDRTEEELRKELLLCGEVGLPRPGPFQQGELNRFLAGLPARRGADCLLGKEPAENLQLLSQKLRQFFQQPQSPDSSDRVEPLRKIILNGDDMWRRPEAIPTLVQMLQAENQPVRLVLIEALAGMDGPQATRALAGRALYDLSPVVRQAAVKALKDRPESEYRDQLLAGLRYPWAPVADHAAEALAALKVQNAVPELMNMLAKPDPAKGASKTPVVMELVKINHQRNCMLCHAPSLSAGDPVRGAVPRPGQSQSSGAPYYSLGGIFVRADVTYVQQDFSVMQPQLNFGPGPAFQRYDYVVRSRRVTVKDASLVQSWQKIRQREAILFALQELTGKEAEQLQLHKALLRDEDHQLRYKQAEVDFWKAQAERLAQEKEDSSLNLESREPTAPVPMTREKLRFNVGSMQWPIVFKEDRKLGSRVRVLAEFLERLDANPGSQELVWSIKEALQVLNSLRAGLEAFPITSLHANEAKNFLDDIETNLWALKRFI